MSIKKAEVFPKHLGLRHYFQSISNSPSRLPLLKKEVAVRLLQELKDDLFNPDTSKWCGIKKFTSYVSQHNIEPGLFIIAIDHIFTTYYKTSSQTKGRQSARKLVDALQQSSTFNSLKGDENIISLQEGSDILNFLEAMEDIRKNYINASQERMIEFISENINTGYTSKTLRRYYYDKKK